MVPEVESCNGGAKRVRPLLERSARTVIFQAFAGRLGPSPRSPGPPPRPQDHPHGIADTFFRELFTDHVDVVFSFHGFPGAIHQLVHGRPDADRFHVRGFIEEGTTTTPFDMVVKNKASRFHLVMDAINNARRTPAGATDLKAWCAEQLARHQAYVVENLQDLPEIREWTWQRG